MGGATQPGRPALRCSSRSRSSGARIGIALLLAAIAGCAPSSQHQLHVDVRTDLTPGIEFVVGRVEVRRESASSPVLASVDHTAAPSDEFLRGQRVADVALSEGDYRVRVALLGPLSALEVDRTVAVHLAGDLSVVVVLTRSCRGVTCAVSQTCVSGACVDPTCPPAGCTPECTSAAACPAAAACASVNCVEGSCFYAGIGGACPAGHWCNPETGCEISPVSMPPDAGPAANDASGTHDAWVVPGQDAWSPPTADCSGRSCGPAHNGIGGANACGSCGSGSSCSGGTCVADAPDCSGLSCGAARNGIGGANACGTCGAGFTCAGGACQCGGGGAGCVSGSCCGTLSCTGGACCEPVGQPCGSGCCPGRICEASRGVCCVVLGDGCSSDPQCCNYPAHQCVSGRCCVTVGSGCGNDAQCCGGSCVTGRCR